MRCGVSGRRGAGQRLRGQFLTLPAMQDRLCELYTWAKRLFVPAPIRVHREGLLAEVSGGEIAAKALLNEGVDTIFFLTGGPITPIIVEANKLGIRCVDVRHEQAAAMMAHGYARSTGKPGCLHLCVGSLAPPTP